VAFQERSRFLEAVVAPNGRGKDAVIPIAVGTMGDTLKRGRRVLRPDKRRYVRSAQNHADKEGPPRIES